LGSVDLDVEVSMTRETKASNRLEDGTKESVEKEEGDWDLKNVVVV